MRISRRVAAVGAMHLAELQRAAEEAGAIDIALGLPTGGPPPPVLDGALAALRDGANQYADPAGLFALRESVAELIRATRGAKVSPDTELTVTCGATEGIFLALLAVTDPGDEVIVFEPYFELYPGMVELVGAVPVLVPLAAPGWRLDGPALRSALTSRTRAILLNTPHNPTGRVFDQQELRDLRDVCAHFGVTCISDEVYEHFVFDGRRHLSPLEQPDHPEWAIVVSSLSKTLEISGWRMGYCVASPPVTAAMRRAHERVTLGTSRPLQTGVIAMPEYETLAAELAVRRDRFARERDLMTDCLRDLGLDVFRPEGGWFMLAGTASAGMSASKLARDLVETARVLVAPGASFFSGQEGDRWFRTTFVRHPADTAAALGRLRKHFTRPRADSI